MTIHTQFLLQKLNQSSLTIRTGIEIIDRMCEVLAKSELIVISALPQMGKTSLMLNMVLDIIYNQELGVGIVSLENAKYKLLEKIVFLDANVAYHKSQNTELLTDNDSKLIDNNFRQLSESNITIRSPIGIPMNQLTKVCKRMVGKGAEIIFIDSILSIHIKRIPLYRSKS